MALRLSLATLLFLYSLSALTAQDRFGPAKLHIINGSTEPVDWFWLKSDNERISNGSIEPGKSTTIRTTIGHRFELIGRTDKTATQVAVETKVQGFRFDPKATNGVPSYYSQVESANGLSVVASARVNPFAVKEAVYLANQMLANRPDVLAAIIKSGARLLSTRPQQFQSNSTKTLNRRSLYLTFGLIRKCWGQSLGDASNRYLVVSATTGRPRTRKTPICFAIT